MVALHWIKYLNELKFFINYFTLSAKEALDVSLDCYSARDAVKRDTCRMCTQVVHARYTGKCLLFSRVLPRIMSSMRLFNSPLFHTWRMLDLRKNIRAPAKRKWNQNKNTYFITCPICPLILFRVVFMLTSKWSFRRENSIFLFWTKMETF